MAARSLSLSGARFGAPDVGPVAKMAKAVRTTVARRLRSQATPRRARMGRDDGGRRNCTCTQAGLRKLAAPAGAAIMVSARTVTG